MQLTVDKLKVKTKCFKPKIKHMSAKGFCLEINAMRHIHCLFFNIYALTTPMSNFLVQTKCELDLTIQISFTSWKS